MGRCLFRFTKQATDDYTPSSLFPFSPDTFANAVQDSPKKAKTDNPALSRDLCPFGIKPAVNKMGPAASPPSRGNESFRIRNFTG